MDGSLFDVLAFPDRFQPLTQILRLIYEYTVEGCDPTELGARFGAAVGSSPFIDALGAAEVAQLEQVLGGGPLSVAPQGQVDVARLEALLRKRARQSEFVQWALIDPLSIYLEGLRHRLI